METENSRTGRQSKNNNLPLLSQDDFVLTGFTHTPNFNKNNTNCMNNLTIFPPEKLDFIRKRSSKKSYYSAKGARILMILGLLLFSISMLAQTIWQDNFNSYANGTENGTGWTTTLTGDVWIQSSRIEANNLPSEGQWISNPISITGISNIGFSFDLATQADISQFEAGTDYFIGEYRIDGGSWIEFENASGDTGDILQSSYSVQFANTGNNLEIRFRFYNTAANEFYYVDNILVEEVVPNQPPVLVATGNSDYCPGPGNSVNIASSISITDPDDTTTNAIYIQISSGYVNGEDLLTLDNLGTHSSNGITASWDIVQGELTLAGPATYNDFELAILDVLYSSSSSIASGSRQFSITVGEANYLPPTGHYYEFVSVPGITWTAAKAAAAARTYYGLQGYLATLTSQIEADFSGSQALGVGWIGASDDAGQGTTGDGDWQWVTGPETGTPFFSGEHPTGTTLTFAFWNNNEPNDYPNPATPNQENYAHITDVSVTTMPGSWNDLPNAGGSGAYAPQGYVVEYGGTSGDPVLNITATTEIDLVLPSTPTFTAISPICAGEALSALPTTSNNGITGTWAPALNNTATTTYTFTPAASECAVPTTLTITVNPLPSVDAGSDEEICQGESVTLTATPSGGSGTYTYLWNTGATTQSITVSPAGDPNLNVNVDYTVTITDTNTNCTASDDVRVRVESNPTATATSTNTICGLNNGSITLTFPDHPNRTGIEFSLDGQATYESNIADNNGSVTYSGLAAGSYDIWVRWGNNECPVDLGSVILTNIPDTTDPIADVASLPSLNAQCEITSLTAPTATDNCDGVLTATTGVSLPITSSTTITWTYTDASGNTATQTQAVVIDDTTDPQLY